MSYQMMLKKLEVPVKSLVPVAAILVLFGWLMYTPPGLLGKADAIGYAVCHRIDARSFHLGERTLPLCARCSGMYLGAVLGLAYQFITVRGRAGSPSWKIILPLLLFVLAFGVDGVNSYFHLFPGSPLPTLYEPQNWLRLLTGTGMGLAMAAALFPAFNQTVWTEPDPRPAISGLKHFSLLIILALVLDAAILTENSVILYPLALISALGVVILLAMVYTVLWITILRRENQFRFAGQLWLPLTAGFMTALLQIGLIDFVRFWLTGTWSGFSLG